MPTVHHVSNNFPRTSYGVFHKLSTHMALSIVVGFIRRTHDGDTLTAPGFRRG
jgi:hypothetical protein